MGAYRPNDRLTVVHQKECTDRAHPSSAHDAERSNRLIHLNEVSVDEPGNDAVRELITDMCDRYLGWFPDEHDRLYQLRLQLANPSVDLRRRSTIPQGHLCGSGIVLLPAAKVLMLHHKSLNMWMVPGGHYDIEDGRPVVTAIRETEEETGLCGVRLHPWHLRHRIPLDIDTHPIPANDAKKEGAHQHFDFRYVLELDDPEHALDRLAVDRNEVLGYQAVALDEVDPVSSIAPALRKLDLLG